MNSDFLSNLLKGQGGASPLTALLPLLLGGAKPNVASLLGAFGGSNGNDKDEGFPPLFGTSESQKNTSDGGLYTVLNRLFSSRNDSTEAKEQTERYPYELQYNRPDIRDLHKN